MILLLASTSSALTLAEAVQRAAEVDPSAVVAELEWRQARLDSAEAWVQLGLTPSLSASRTVQGAIPTDRVGVDVSVGALSPPDWFNAAQQSAQAGAAREVSSATTLDAQYAAATLYYGVLSAEAGVASAKEGERFAQATFDATSARVAAGLESELAGRSARLGVLEAQALLAQSEAVLAIARASLSRALEQDIGALEAPPALPELPADAAGSPWITAAKAELSAARYSHYEAIAGIFPTGELSTSSNLPFDSWAVTIGARWSFDGLAGPFLRAKNAALSQKIAEVQLDALERDQELGLTTARELARAARRVAEAARAREELAEESLLVGQSRLSVGLASSLEVLRLQDEAARARADHIEAELDEASARLEALRVGGVNW